MANHEFITGEAGTGKSTLLKQRGGLIASTTGISAVNMGTVTINSLLKYYNTDSLRRAAISGKLERKICGLMDNGVLVDRLGIDEISMMAPAQLDIIFNALAKHASGVTLTLTGDFAQLPPVDSEEGFAFDAKCWGEFAMTRLTTVHRQHDAEFLAALRLIRRGDGLGAVWLAGAGAQFEPQIDPNFQGITLTPTNSDADSMNGRKLAALGATAKLTPAVPTGEQAPEWREIPAALMLKVGARVMITANDIEEFEYANGDTGVIVALPDGGMAARRVVVRLDRNQNEVCITPVVRRWFDYSRRPAALLGSITFMPLKLGWALTIHKSQGLTLPAVQITTDHWFAGNPALMYVAISRAREAKDIRIVGSVNDLGRRIKLHPGVESWL